MAEWCKKLTGKDLKGTVTACFKILPSGFVERLRETTEKLSWDTQTTGQKPNSEHHESKTRTVTTHDFQKLTV